MGQFLAFFIRNLHIMRRSIPLLSLFILISAFTVFSTLRWNFVVRQMRVPGPWIPTEGNSLGAGFLPLAWSPKNPNLEKIMNYVNAETGLELASFPNSNELVKFIGNRSATMLNAAGIQFDDNLAGDVALGPEIHVRFRLIRLTKGALHKLYGEIDDPVDAGNYEERFMYLQDKISRAILRFHDVKVTDIQLRQLPEPSYIKAFGELSIILYPILFCAAVVGVYIAITLSIIRERNRQIRESLEMSGVSLVMLWGAWLFTGTVMVFFFALVVTLLVYFIPALEGPYLINNTSISIILFLNLLFGAAISSVAILTSTIIKKEEYCAIFTIFLLILSVMPVLTVNGPTIKTFIFCPTTAYIIGLYNIFLKENYMSGYSWNNLNQVATYFLNVPLSMVFVALFIETIGYLIIAVYLDAVMVYTVGYPKPWNFFCKWNFWRKQNQLNSEDEYELRQKNPLPTGKSFQPDPKLPVAIRAVGLTKEFNKKVVVDNVTFNIYENQISVLIGHNGAGKSTTVNMITGVLPPTSGTAVINGHDIRYEKKRARSSMGFCPQQNLFFEELTVSEQLSFFARVRGSKFSEARKEIQYLCSAAQLNKALHSSVKHLSGGSKRKLGVLTALCGNTKLIILDEPTSGVDPINRKSMWGILRALKQDRTILLITHHMDEADSLGDRIILLNGGRLQTIGSGSFLKKEYEIGYRIAIEKGPDCDEGAVTSFMKARGGQLHRISGNDLVYEVPMSNITDAVQSLESFQEPLHVSSFGVSRTPLDEIFIEYVVEKHDEKATVINTSQLEMSKPSLRRQFTALMYKKIICSLRDRYAFLQIAIVFILYLVPIIFSTVNKALTSDMLKMSLADYYDVIALTEGSDNAYWPAYKEIVEEHGGVVEVVKGKTFIQEAFNKALQDFNFYQNRYVIGASFGPSIVAYYNRFEDHSMPLSYSVVVNAILRKEMGKQYKIHIYTYPEPVGVSNVDDLVIQCICCLSFGFGIAGAIPLLFYSDERKNKSLHLQIISGANVALYWLTALLWEMLVMTICALIVATISRAMDLKGLEKYEGFNRGFVMFFVGGFHITCFIFLMSHIGWSAEYMVSTFMVVLIGLGFFNWGFDSLLQPDTAVTNPDPIVRFVYRLLLSLPMYNMIESYMRMLRKKQLIKVCLTVGDCEGGWTKECAMRPCGMPLFRKDCCNFTMNYFEWDHPGIGGPIAYAVCVAIFYLFLTILIDSSVLKYFLRTERAYVRPHRIDDEDILEEKRKMKSLSRSEIQENYQIALANVSKVFCKMGNFCRCKLCRQVAVRNAYLGVKSNESFALLGLNGAGKTTTFEIITGEIAANSGMIFVNGQNIRRETNKVQRSIGYCPQTDTVITHFTGRENLVYFLILRGYSKNSAEILAEAIARKHGFYSHIDKRVNVYSGGNKRKLCLAIALLGDAPILALDEPTSGVDPGSRRYMFSLITEASRGKTTLLTTHHLEDCEAICTRALIMANGKFKCIGSLQHLKTKFAAGYFIIIKLEANKQGNPPTDTQLKSLKDYMFENFADPPLVEELLFSLTYRVSNKDTPWSKAFSVMENAEKSFPIEDISIEQCGLDEVFLKVAGKKKQL